MVRMMVFVPAPASPPEEDRPGQNEQSDKAHRADGEQMLTRGRI
jgi:hypothetical protein